VWGAVADVHDTETGVAASGARSGDSAGLVRDRLTSRLSDPSAYRVGWVVAPAGSGKSRLLSHAVDRFAGSSVWCEMPDPVPRSEAALVMWIWERLKSSGVSWAAGEAPTTVEGLVAAGKSDNEPLLIALDDVHLLDGSEAEPALGTLVTRLPASWTLIVASRMNLDVDLSRLRVSGQVIDIGADDLRFRTWEVEELFRNVYGEPLLPEDVAMLTRRTAGWAAYLQLFFLATARRPQAERRLVLGSLRHRTRLVSEYLARHVLAGLAPELQDFLIRTSALRRPSGRLADEFLGWESGSAEILAELERRRLFTERQADDSYRYHAVLLAYLDAKLVEIVGLGAAREQHRRAGELLEREGWTEEALAAYARAEDWPAISRLLGRSGVDPEAIDESWADALPPAVVESDPLLLMALARGEIVRGRLAPAAATLRRAEEASASAAVAERCRVQRDQVLAWAEPDRPVPPGWVGTIRAATQRQPLEARRQASSLRGVSGRFAEGCSAFIGGDVAGALRALRSVAAHPDATPVPAAAAGMLAIVASAMMGRTSGPEAVPRALEGAEASGARWLDRMVRAAFPAGAAGATDSGDDTVDDLISACDREGDSWGAATISAVGGLRRLVRRDSGAESMLSWAADSFHRLGAGALEALCLAYAALSAAGAGDPESVRTLAGRARALGSSLDVPAAVAVSALALASVGLEPGGLASARAVLEPFGSWEWHRDLAGSAAGAEPAQATPPRSEERPGAPVRIRCLGGFEMEVEGRAVDEEAAKPMERALLHLLALGAGSPHHRETLVSSLWPDADAEAGLHRLQVAVSSLRRLVGRVNGNELVARTGDTYRLALPEGSSVDTARFEEAAERSVAARSAGDVAGERGALEEAFALYRGELLPADGPAEWVIEPRRWLIGRYSDVCARLAAALLEDDQPRETCRVARSGLTADRYRDDLWKLLIDGAEHAGNHAEAETARREYETLLNDLGV
jgi:DNA-binding SARP family transcriptional activator